VATQINLQASANSPPFPNSPAPIDASDFASISATGQLILNGQGSNVVIDELDSAVTVGGTTRGFSHFFGLNNLFEAGTNMETFDSNVIAANTTAAAGGTLTIQSTDGATPNSFTAVYNAGDTLANIAESINAAAGASGVTATVQTVTGGARLRIDGPDGQNLLVTDSGALAAALNLRPGVFKSAQQLQVRDDILGRPDLMSRGKLQDDGAGGFYISSDDDTAAREISERFTDTLTFATIGGQPSVGDTLGGFANQLLAFQATRTNEANNILDYQDTLRRNIADKNSSFSGVNLDEELSNMVIYQNAYQASARLVRTTQEMFETLTQLV
jgi:flagellar hook-associated protein 1 FlgK